MAKKNSTGGGFVFSTNPDFKWESESEEPEALAPEQQQLRIWLQRIKGNKEATVIKGYVGPDGNLEDLAKI